MAIQIFNKSEAGQGLEFANGKYNVKAADNTIQVTSEGIKAIIPATPEVPTVVKELTITGNTINVTKTDASTSTLQLPTTPVDIHFENATFADGKLKVTLSDGTSKETDFAAEVVIKALESADEGQKTRLANLLKETLLTSIKGDEVQDSNGTKLGYLLAK